MNHRIPIITALALLLAIGTSDAATYYVSTTGSDGYPGTSSLPWRTLQHAADSVAAGDTVFIREGAYAGFNATSAGSSGSPITFRAEDGADVIIDSPGPDSSHSSNIEIEGYDWWVIEFLEVMGAGLAGIDVRESDHVTVRSCHSHHNFRWGIFTAYADYFTAEDNECSYSEDEHGIYHSNSADHPVIRGNICHHNNACGIQLNADPLYPGDKIISDAIVEKNTVHGNGAAGGAGINLASVRDSLIANNLIYGNSAGGIAGWDDGAGEEWGCKDNRFLNNTVHMPSAARWALSLKNGSSGNEVVNNILIHDGTRGGLETDSSSLTGLESDYNVLGRVSVDETAMTLAAWQSGYSRDLHSASQSASETFELPGSDYRLRVSAHALDHGATAGDISDDIEGTLRPQGGAYDIGCYEYAGITRINFQPPGSTIPGGYRRDDGSSYGAHGSYGWR